MGNYDMSEVTRARLFVTPLREKMGNYDWGGLGGVILVVTPLREKMGNYDYVLDSAPDGLGYTTTRENGELRPPSAGLAQAVGYTTTKVVHPFIISF